MRILIIDDENIARQAIKKMLNTFGYKNIFEAATGSEGLQLTLKFQPDIIFADIEMPNLNGIEMLRNIRDLGLNTAVVFISGHDIFTYAQKALSLNATDYLLKPISIDELYESINKILKTHNFDHTINPPILLNESYNKKIINTAKSYIQKHLADDISLVSLSEYVHLSPSYFSSLFKQICGEKLTDYINKMRIEKAKNLLLTGIYKGSEVSNLTGFNEVRYFYKVFRKYTGLSPSDFRSLTLNINNTEEDSF